MAADRSTTSEINLRLGDELFARFVPPSTESFPSVAETVYDQLWRRIVNREFRPGDRLVEDALANELGTSRTPVREALLRLGQTGLVQVSSRKGFSVPVITPDDVVELYDLRAALETYAIRRATPLISDEEIEMHRNSQEAVLRQSEERDTATAEAFFRADLALHSVLHSLGGNARSARILSEVMGQLSLISMRASLIPERNQLAIAEHHVILDALAARDPETAAEAMAAHIEAVKTRSLADLEGGVR
ncbi:MAG: GntR family transcriptional regulator [Thermomicrobiales bacterium]|nr:GntR family transcriptional regulator [Thermomicrobiales bacterium]